MTTKLYDTVPCKPGCITCTTLADDPHVERHVCAMGDIRTVRYLSPVYPDRVVCAMDLFADGKGGIIWRSISTDIEGTGQDSPLNIIRVQEIVARDLRELFDAPEFSSPNEKLRWLAGRLCEQEAVSTLPPTGDDHAELTKHSRELERSIKKMIYKEFADAGMDAKVLPDNLDALTGKALFNLLAAIDAGIV